MTFQWDEAKNEKNRKKHGVSFELAALVFADPLAVSRRDKTTGEEERWQTMGQVQGVLMLLVVHTMWQEGGEDTIRLISARKATTREKREYENGTWNS